MMKQKKQAFRHELKYEINYAEYLSLRSKLRAIMPQDRNVRADGTYQIRSIYFDNFEDKALREKIDGINMREKFRIRYYNDDLSYISLEKKVKTNHLGQKYSARLTQEEYKKILNGDVNWMFSHENFLIRELYAKWNYQLMRPRVVVSYVREPYIFRAGNVRICFDFDIRSSLFRKVFDGDDITDISAMEETGQIILEVKYDAYLPEVIACLVQTEDSRVQAFSKYGACRKFG